jgi:hypothetical protein
LGVHDVRNSERVNCWTVGSIVKLVTRIPLTFEEEASMELTGILPGKLEGYESGRLHGEPKEVGVFLKMHGLPWKPRFVPVFIYDDSENPDPPGASVKAYGHPFLLRNETVLADLELVCCDDIQNAVLNKRSPSDFTDLRHLSPDEIERALQNSRSNAARYAEARLHRRLSMEDVDRAL